MRASRNRAGRVVTFAIGVEGDIRGKIDSTARIRRNQMQRLLSTLHGCRSAAHGISYVCLAQPK